MENRTIEDKIFDYLTGGLRKKDYVKGSNEDLTIECRMCGDNTKRGEYYVRLQKEPDSTYPYGFICPDCYNHLKEGDTNE